MEKSEDLPKYYKSIKVVKVVSAGGYQVLVNTTKDHTPGPRLLQEFWVSCNINLDFCAFLVLYFRISNDI